MSGLETSGDFGPPPSPCFGPQGTGAAGFSVRSGMKKRYPECTGNANCRPACQRCARGAKLAHDSPPPFARDPSFFSLAHDPGGCPKPGSRRTRSEAAELLSLTKKIDEQNMKIDALSQQILRLQQEIERSEGNLSRQPVAGRRGNSFTAARRGWLHPRRCPGRDAHFDRENAQSRHRRAAKIQPHRERPETSDRPDARYSRRANPRTFPLPERLRP